MQLRCALLKAHQVEAPRAKDNKGQRQHNRHLAEGRQRGWDGGGDDAGAARQPARPQNTYAKKEMQEVRVAPTSSAKWPIEITGDKEDAVIAEDCRTTTG